MKTVESVYREEYERKDYKLPSFWRIFCKNFSAMIYEFRYLIGFVSVALFLFCMLVVSVKMPSPPKVCQMQYGYGKLFLHVQGSDAWIFATEPGPNAVDEVLTVAKKLNCPVVP